MKKQQKLKLFTYLACSVFISVVLLSNIGTVQASRNTEIASQANLQLDARALAKRLYDEGLKLYKLSTAESLQQAIGKWKEALKLYQKIGDKNSQGD